MKLEPQNSSQEQLEVVKSQEKRVWMEQHGGVGDARPGGGKTRGNSLLKDERMGLGHGGKILGCQLKGKWGKNRLFGIPNRPVFHQLWEGLESEHFQRGI